MSRDTRIINMSLPSDIYREVDKLAQRERVAKSELLRRALRQYVFSEKRWREIYRAGEKSAKELGIKDEKDVERIIHQFRKEQAKS